MDRRGFLSAAGAALLSGALASRAAARDAVGAVTWEELAPGLGLVRGGGGNVTVLDSPEGVLMVDGGSPERSSEVLRLVRAHTGQSRVQVLFNTHWHWDHTGSNAALGSAGTKILAHENTRLWLGTQVDSKWEHRVYAPLPPKARPNQTFYTHGSLSFGGERIDYGHLPQAHTDGDIYVHFRNADVLVASDVLSSGAYPIIDYCTHGWIGGMVNATQALMDRCTPQTRVIGGSGGVLARADLDKEHAMLATLKKRLSKLLAQGMSVEDMLAAAPTREFDPEWGDPHLFIANVWPGLVDRSRELGVSIV
jgi:glyoxylase-like metal-dependent hydrolase (beta-lactamase superfamily II)